MKTYTDKTRYLFTQLRARGISLGVISNELDIPKSTLGDWDQLLADEIARLRAIEWEAVEEQFGRTLERDLRAMVERIRKWEARIDRMNPDHFKVREVLAVLRETRREYFRRRAILMAPLEGSLTRAVSRGLNRRPDESGRFPFSSDTEPCNTNDLQRPPSEPSGDGARPSPVAATPDQPAVAQSADTETASVIDSSLDIRHSSLSAGGERHGEGDSSVAARVDHFKPAQPTSHAGAYCASVAAESRAAETNQKTPTSLPSPRGCGTESSADRNTLTRQGEGLPSSFTIDSSLDIRHSSLPAGGEGQGEGLPSSFVIDSSLGISHSSFPQVYE